MAGEERPFKPRTTKSMAADEAVTGQKGPFLKRCTTIHLAAKDLVAGEECPLKGCHPMEKGLSKAGQLRMLKPCTTTRKAEEAAAAGEECPLKGCHPMEKGLSKAGQLRMLKPCTTKRKAEEAAAAGEECPLKVCTTKRKVEAAAIGRSEGEEAGYAAVAAAISESEKSAAAKSEEVPGKKLTRLPQEEVEWILAHVVGHRAPRDFESLKRQNPDLLPSPEEEMDESRVVFYTAARTHYAARERFSELQAWVCSEHEKYGYVEVDDDFLARRAQVQAWSDEAREEALKDITLSDTDDEGEFDDKDVSLMRSWF